MFRVGQLKPCPLWGLPEPLRPVRGKPDGTWPRQFSKSPKVQGNCPPNPLTLNLKPKTLNSTP